MTLDPGTSAAGQLRSHLATSLSGDPAWDLALSRLARGEVGLHLAVLTEPFCSLLLDGAKTIESRFSHVRCAPYGTLAKGDIVVVKKTGGPVTGAFQAGTVRSYHLTPPASRSSATSTPHRSAPATTSSGPIAPTAPTPPWST